MYYSNVKIDYIMPLHLVLYVKQLLMYTDPVYYHASDRIYYYSVCTIHTIIRARVCIMCVHILRMWRIDSLSTRKGPFMTGAHR